MCSRGRGRWANTFVCIYKWCTYISFTKTSNTLVSLLLVHVFFGSDKHGNHLFCVFWTRTLWRARRAAEDLPPHVLIKCKRVTAEKLSDDLLLMCSDSEHQSMNHLISEQDTRTAEDRSFRGVFISSHRADGRLLFCTIISPSKWIVSIKKKIYLRIESINSSCLLYYYYRYYFIVHYYLLYYNLLQLLL